MRTLLLTVFCLGLLIVIVSNRNLSDAVEYQNCYSCTEAGYSWCEVNNGIFWQGKCSQDKGSCVYGSRQANSTSQCDCFSLWYCDDCLHNDNCTWCNSMQTCTGRYSSCSEHCSYE